MRLGHAASLEAAGGSSAVPSALSSRGPFAPFVVRTVALSASILPLRRAADSRTSRCADGDSGAHHPGLVWSCAHVRMLMRRVLLSMHQVTLGRCLFCGGLTSALPPSRAVTFPDRFDPAGLGCKIWHSACFGAESCSRAEGSAVRTSMDPADRSAGSGRGAAQLAWWALLLVAVLPSLDLTAFARRRDLYG